jgi:hydrogenase maturation protease
MPAPALDIRDGPDTLVYGIGNVGRQDDGLGWAFIDWVEAQGRWPRTRLVRGYQLALEDADLLSRVDRVLFVDSTKDPQVRRYAVYRPEPRLDFSFTSHALSIPAVLATCDTCFGRVPQAQVLAIRGYSWDLSVGLTTGAAGNLAAALHELSSAHPCPIP